VTKNQTHEQLPLRVAVSSIVSPRETLTIYQPLLDYLEKQVGIPVVLLQRKTYKEVNDLLRDGVADMAFVCSGGYVAGRQAIPLELLAVPIVNGQTLYQSYIITHSQLEAESIIDLRGRSFAFTDPMSFSGRIAPVDLLESQGLDSAHFFGRTFFTYSHDNAIKAVVDGIADAAAVDSMILDQALQKDPGIGKRLKIIAKSIQVGNPPVVIHSNVENKRKETLRNALLTMHESERGKKALFALQYDKFSAGDEAAYLVLQTMWNQVKEKL
jgi:phosphonate transport system substrate-binding protein